MPAIPASTLTESEKPIEKVEGVKFVRQEPDKIILEVSSGTYHFLSEIRRTELTCNTCEQLNKKRPETSVSGPKLVAGAGFEPAAFRL
jgi:hypothetical protein